MPDPIFAEPRLAALYDVLDDDRSDLDVYVDIVKELGASKVLDVGCGTGTLACMLAHRGIACIGLDPAQASLDIAGRKPGAGAVQWVCGDASTMTALDLDLDLDLAVMSGNVAQVFTTDAAWANTLKGIRGALRDEGWLVFESRDPAKRAWERWSKEHTYSEHDVPRVGLVTTWTELVDVQEPLVTFRHVFRFASDSSEITSESTLRFRNRDEIDSDLRAAGFLLDSIRDAPDRPGLELVFLARC